MILGLQIIALVFSLVMIYFAYMHFRRGEMNAVEIISWLVTWSGAILIISFPEIFSIFAKKIAISRAFDLAVLGGFLLIIPLVYASFIKVRRIEKKLEKFVREEALRGREKTKNKTS